MASQKRKNHMRVKLREEQDEEPSEDLDEIEDEEEEIDEPTIIFGEDE